MSSCTQIIQSCLNRIECMNMELVRHDLKIPTDRKFRLLLEKKRTRWWVYVQLRSERDPSWRTLWVVNHYHEDHDNYRDMLNELEKYEKAGSELNFKFEVVGVLLGNVWKERKNTLAFKRDRKIGECEKCKRVFKTNLDHGKSLCDLCAYKAGIPKCIICDKKIHNQKEWWGLPWNVHIHALCDSHKSKFVNYLKKKCNYTPGHGDTHSQMKGYPYLTKLEGVWGVEPNENILTEYVSNLLKRFSTSIQKGRVTGFCSYGTCTKYAQTYVRNHPYCNKHGKDQENGID